MTCPNSEPFAQAWIIVQSISTLKCIIAHSRVRPLLLSFHLYRELFSPPNELSASTGMASKSQGVPRISLISNESVDDRPINRRRED